MTAINNHLTLIEQVGGIEKAKEIVDGAPEWATHFSKGYYYIRTTGDLKMWGEWWFNIEPHKSRRLKCLKNLRTAIAQHEQGGNSSEFKVGDFVIDPQHTGLLKVTRVMKKRLNVDYLNPQTLDIICHHSILIRHIRHATPSEIKAGHRLDAT